MESNYRKSINPFFQFMPFTFVSDDSSQAGLVDWFETPNTHIIRANVPGMSREDIKVMVEDGNILQIKSEGVKENDKLEGIWHCMERGKGGFSRQFRLPDDVKTEQVKAHVENGVLTVIAPKDTNPKSKTRMINISSKM